jgi:hypothetical protein
MGHLFTRLLGPHLCPKSPSRPLRSNGGARGSEIKNSHPLVLLQNPSHFSLYPTENTRERERESVCAGAPVAPPMSLFVGARAHLRLSTLPSSGPAVAPLAAQGPPQWLTTWKTRWAIASQPWRRRRSFSKHGCAWLLRIGDERLWYDDNLSQSLDLLTLMSGHWGPFMKTDSVESGGDEGGESQALFLGSGFGISLILPSIWTKPNSFLLLNVVGLEP